MNDSFFDRGKCCDNCVHAVENARGDLCCCCPTSIFAEEVVNPENKCVEHTYDFPFPDGSIENLLRTVDSLCKRLHALRGELADVRAKFKAEFEKQDYIEPLKWSKPKTICDDCWTQWRAKLECLTFTIDKQTDGCGDTWSFSAKLGGKKKIIKTLEEAKARVELLREAIIMTAKGGAK